MTNDNLEDVDLSHEASVKAIKDKFSPAEQEVAELAKDEKPKELTEDFIQRFYEAEIEARRWKDKMELMRRIAKELAGKDRGLVARGNWALDVQAKKGQRRLDHEALEKWVMETIGEGIPENCYTVGDEQVIVRPKKIR